MKSMKLHFIFIMIFVVLFGCIPKVSKELNSLNEQDYFAPSNIVLDDIKLSKDDIPGGYEFGEEPLSYSIQVYLFYEGTNMKLCNLPTFIEKDFQTIIGKDERGSVYYFKFDRPLSISMQGRIRRLLYGSEMSPSMEHPEQLYVNNNLMIIWAFRRNSEVMKFSQTKLTNYLSGINKSGDYGWVIKVSGKGKGQFNNPECGKINFCFPDSWGTELTRPKPGIYTIIFEPFSRKSFKLMFDPLCTAVLDWAKTEPIKRQVEKQGNEALPFSLEKILVLNELIGTTSTGYYYSLTDKAPREGEWKCMTQGKIGVGPYVLYFTVFTQSLEIKELNDALSMLSSATFSNE